MVIRKARFDEAYPRSRSNGKIGWSLIKQFRKALEAEGESGFQAGECSGKPKQSHAQGDGRC